MPFVTYLPPPHQVARHLASEISQETALRVVALPHTEGALWSTTPTYSMLTYLIC